MRLTDAFAAALEDDLSALQQAHVATAPQFETPDDALRAPSFEFGGAMADVQTATPMTTTTIPSVGENQVLQMAEVPITINPTQYANAHSNQNPTGDMRSLFAFRELVDPLPSVGPTFIPSASSTEMTYDLVVNNANALSGNPFAAQTLAMAQRGFSNSKFANLDGTAGDWRAVYAAPEDWYDSTQTNRFRPLTLPLGSGVASKSIKVPEGSETLKLSNDDNDKTLEVPTSQVTQVSFKYLMVSLHRPWMLPQLFSTNGWYLGQQKRGFCSNGKTSKNKGVLPLIPSALIVGLDSKVQATWSKKEKAFLKEAKDAKASAYLGPFKVQNGANPPPLQVVGCISDVTPLSPQETSPG
ncbi:hypothetical protein [Shimia ponticola]|uniref:hypothetical protein n=1 Tax=Shimia ponticola TaxID=2582893 RepID=UPI0011BF856C|nr:hypothetical protein [Shimia ponticola]